ncbi:hypothetical protein HU200_000761 [Digitaria exilis]|uniref:Uncharacterized protein n=1 Tax=Digitaria exilis TaxID=1010633 RepID=A0A835G0N9_9POAL|nr:hypothetical protein HU200_000761 [Digitaria exilis]
MADERSEQSIHVLLLPYPTQGHINPILQFGKRLAARRGVRCTLAATRFVLSQSQPSPGDAIRIATISDGCDTGGFEEAGGVEAYLARLETTGSETVDALLRSEAALGRPVHALVYDAFMPWAQQVARRHGVASVAFFTQPCAVDVAYAHAFTGAIRPPIAEEEGPVELPGLPAGRSAVVSGRARLPRVPGHAGEPVQWPRRRRSILVNSFHELEPQVCYRSLPRSQQYPNPNPEYGDNR